MKVVAAQPPTFLKMIRLFFWQTRSRLYPNFINWSSSCESSAFHMPPCKPSGRHQFRRWCRGLPGSGTRSDTAQFPPSHSALQGQLILLSGLARRRPAMTPFLMHLLKLPTCPAFRCSRNRPAACCGLCVNPTRPSSPIVRDAWSFQGEWLTSVLNLTAWPCKRRPLSPIDDFPLPGKTAGKHTTIQKPPASPVLRTLA